MTKLEKSIMKSRMRRATSAIRKLPNYIIIGTLRAGTTSLFNYIGEHPDVSNASVKEINFFNENFEKGLEWYKQYFPISGYTGEASPEYMYYEKVATRIYKTIPEAKIIVMLRNPIERAWSDYKMRKSWNVEKRTFMEAIEDDKYLYLKRGLYLTQLKFWEKKFPDMLVFDLDEDLNKNLDPTMRKVFNFLGLNPINVSGTHYNTTRQQIMPKFVRQFLTDYYKKPNKELMNHLHRKFNWE